MKNQKRKSPHESGRKKAGRRRLIGRGDWLSKRQISFQSGVSSTTVQKYLAMPGAPAPNGRGLFSLAAFLTFYEEHGPGRDSAEMRRLRERRLRIQVEDSEFEAAKKRGGYVAMAEIEPAISGMMQGLTADMRAKLEFELPDKYAGCGAIQCKEMNAAAIDWILRRLKDGAAAVTSPQPTRAGNA